MIILGLIASPALSDDWPQWRGIHRDAKIDEPGLMKTLPTGHLERKWQVELGAGYSGPTIVDGRVYVTDRGLDDSPEEIERVLCFDAENGDLVWQHTYPAVYGEIGYRAGPRASVTVHEGLALSVGTAGHFICFDAKTGDIRWQHDLAPEYSIRMPIWGIATSPLVHDGNVIQVVAGAGDACVVAFDLATGKERWRSIDEKAGYSSPILIQQAGQDVVVCWTGESVTGLDPRTGQVHWTIPMLPRNMPIGIPTPVVQDDLLFVSSFYDGSMLIRFDPNQLTAEKVWHRVGIDEKNTDALHCMISNPIIKGDYIYGTDSYGELRCLDIKTGDRVWEDTTAVPRARWATIHTIRDGQREIMQNDQGELIFATLTPEGFQEHSRTKLLDPTRKQLNRRGGVTWSHPAIANGYIFARNDQELICASLKEPADTP
ncbi:PQQ-binding-like beta-propeller repeat protein [Rubripirellula lacrimiformis]|uniref:PQQ-binding-like beta-propeller repeat protein n=1 Tax=Rubripirellula lacrimiformis TaxID=1930273 RepID=UPI001FE7C020|nr:PQQ-binding-like beta-propeller repeat protein [Rubripirellula lacrimiformis]